MACSLYVNYVNETSQKNHWYGFTCTRLFEWHFYASRVKKKSSDETMKNSWVNHSNLMVQSNAFYSNRVCLFDQLLAKWHNCYEMRQIFSSAKLLSQILSVVISKGCAADIGLYVSLHNNRNMRSWPSKSRNFHMGFRWKKSLTLVDVECVGSAYACKCIRTDSKSKTKNQTQGKISI